MSFGELSIQFFLLLSFLPNLTSTGNKFYLVETLNNAERTRDQDEPRENGHDYSETYEPEGERNYPEISAKDYAELTYAYGALGYDYSLGKETVVCLEIVRVGQCHLVSHQVPLFFCGEVGHKSKYKW